MESGGKIAAGSAQAYTDCIAKGYGHLTFDTDRNGRRFRQT